MESDFFSKKIWKGNEYSRLPLMKKKENEGFKKLLMRSKP
jgi:hypothetical protein